VIISCVKLWQSGAELSIILEFAALGYVCTDKLGGYIHSTVVPGQALKIFDKATGEVSISIP
tara:strand:+ start:116 stop:301 length:186 start_codon:yes stop_codon:yes gene_type:complete